MDDETLIEQVRQYEVLYNMKHQKYSDKIHKAKLWARIGRELNTTGPTCKARWISLRNHLRMKLKSKITKTGQASGTTKKWKFEDCMSFVIPFFKESETPNYITALEKSDEESNGEEVSYVSTTDKDTTDDNAEKETHAPLYCKPAKAPSTKLSPRISKVEGTSKLETASSICTKFSDKHESKTTSSTLTNGHPIDIFFNGLAATVKTFPLDYQHMAKSKMFEIMSALDWAQLQEQKTSYEISSATSLPANKDINLPIRPMRSSDCEIIKQYNVEQLRNFRKLQQLCVPTSTSSSSQNSEESTQNFNINIIEEIVSNTRL